MTIMCSIWKTPSAGRSWLTPAILATQEDGGLKPAWANSSRDPISKIPITKTRWQSGSRWRPWVQVPVLPKRNILSFLISQCYWSCNNTGWLHLKQSVLSDEEKIYRNFFLLPCTQKGCLHLTWFLLTLWRNKNLRDTPAFGEDTTAFSRLMLPVRTTQKGVKDKNICWYQKAAEAPEIWEAKAPNN
jgi:hypothetical protein